MEFDNIKQYVSGDTYPLNFEKFINSYGESLCDFITPYCAHENENNIYHMKKIVLLHDDVEFILLCLFENKKLKQIEITSNTIFDYYKFCNDIYKNDDQNVKEIREKYEKIHNIERADNFTLLDVSQNNIKVQKVKRSYSVSGNSIMSLIAKLSEAFNISVMLNDQSGKLIDANNYVSLKLLYIIKYGCTWYSKFGFVPVATIEVTKMNKLIDTFRFYKIEKIMIEFDYIVNIIQKNKDVQIFANTKSNHSTISDCGNKKIVNDEFVETIKKCKIVINELKCKTLYELSLYLLNDDKQLYKFINDYIKSMFYIGDNDNKFISQLFEIWNILDEFFGDMIKI